MQQTEQAQGTQAPRNRLLPNRITLDEIAEAIDGCERTARSLMDRLGVPYVRVKNIRLYDRDVVRAAILAREVNRQPRRPGRPRRAA